MKRFFHAIIDVTRDTFLNVGNFIVNNLMNFANLLNVLLPFAMYFVGQKNFNLSWELAIPLGILILIYYAKNVANKLGKGVTIPLPEKRFTEIGDEGEVSIENSRLQELLLYTADLEDWLERKGLL